MKSMNVIVLKLSVQLLLQQLSLILELQPAFRLIVDELFGFVDI